MKEPNPISDYVLIKDVIHSFWDEDIYDMNMEILPAGLQLCEITRCENKNFHRVWYTCKNKITGASCDIDDADALAEVTEENIKNIEEFQLAQIKSVKAMNKMMKALKKIKTLE